ncbi:MAG: AMP-binding protein [Oscillospiraceae bacterium]|nr:AMP-binding protein [Oscillospiraceae bacterium]
MTISRIDALLHAQEGLKDISRGGIEGLQLQKLNALLAREKARGGFYRDLPGHLDSLSELAALPFTTDEDLAHQAPGLLLCSQAEVQRVLSDATSGTTGAAKRVFYTEGDCEHTVELFAAGLGELIFPGSVTMVCFPFSGPHGLGELIAEAIGRLGARTLRLGVGLSYGEYAAVLEKERPDTFVGMPVQLLSLLRVCGRGSLRRALISGDACPAAVIRGCEAILQSRLFPHYGSREMALGGAICCQAHAGMHLRENHVIAEIVDEAGRPLSPGEKGELVITTIGMEAMPLIRYRTGDYTRVIPGRCPCGSEVLRLDTVSRKETAELAALDEGLFSLPFVADYRAERREGRLRLQILTCGEGRLPALDAETEVRPARPEDRSLYVGKRKVEER